MGWGGREGTIYNFKFDGVNIDGHQPLPAGGLGVLPKENFEI